MRLMTIGEFAQQTRLSPKALRLYDRLGLVVPASIDPANGYRIYRDDQVQRARTVGLLRRLDMPLASIAKVVDAAPERADELLGGYWERAEATMAERRALVTYLRTRLRGADMPTYSIQTRHIAERRVLSISRHLHAAKTDAFFDDAFARLRAAGPGLEGVAGAPYLVFYGEVSEDSDGPMELCRPVSSRARLDMNTLNADVEVRSEPAHDEAFVHLRMAEMGWPGMLPVFDALEGWVTKEHRRPRGPIRQVLIADQRTASPDTLVCDLTVPLF